MAVDDDWLEVATSQMSFDTSACQGMSLEAEQLNRGMGALELLSAVEWSWKFGCEEKTLYVL
jgi:hypothetical protein